MRLRNWLAVVISVILLASAGMIGILLNRSELLAADDALLSDARALALHDGALVRQTQTRAAEELDDFLDEHTLKLGKNNATDRKALGTLVDESEAFQYGAMTSDPSGDELSASRTGGLPAATDTGWTPLRKQVAEGETGFSSIMRVNGTYLQAVGVPVLVDDAPKGVLIGLTEIAATALQKYVASLKDGTHTTTVVDSEGTIGITDAVAQMGTRADPAIRAALSTAGTFRFIEYSTTGGTRMLAAIVGLAGGGAYVRSQTLSSFDGGVRDESRTLNLILIAVLLIGIIAITAIGYRAFPDRHRGRHRGLL
jgi:hypothetical protein